MVSKCLLKTLEIECCPALKSIPSINGLTSLHSFTLRSCDGIACLPSGLQSCTSLKTLRVESCHNLISFPDIQALHSLSTLQITSCEKITRLPGGLHCLTRLVNLMVGPFSEELNSFPSLEGVQHLQASLRYVYLCGWPHWNSIPEQLQYLTVLKSIELSGFGVEALPDWFENFSYLESLSLDRFESIKFLLPREAMRHLTKLESLRIQNCPLLKERYAKALGPKWLNIAHISRIVI
ncbi:unnamed protein product [Ilex paraguariensis]|uniref:R13L1/DRL21-like LRR repeat region domain-containing protein n=1 Tax=Ilex paraguariensis TaxID=185542 RepID=A0ABC8R4Q9_9AQUA